MIQYLTPRVLQQIFWDACMRALHGLMETVTESLDDTQVQKESFLFISALKLVPFLLHCPLSYLALYFLMATHKLIEK